MSSDHTPHFCDLELEQTTLDDPGTDASTAVLEQPRPVGRLPQWRVLLHNDDVNDMVYVVCAIRRLTSLDYQSATECMLQAHTDGLTLLLTTHREHAELLHEQFNSLTLTVTIEPDR